MDPKFVIRTDSTHAYVQTVVIRTVSVVSVVSDTYHNLSRVNCIKAGAFSLHVWVLFNYV